jgi:hypothetical protein
MRRILFTQLTHNDLIGLVKLEDHRIRADPWDEMARGDLTENERQFIEQVLVGLRRVTPSLVNEATVWCKAIYPLLSLAETDDLVAQADVPLSGRIGDVELAGNADGAFGTPSSGDLEAPFLIVVEAKRGVEGSNPVPQLYGEILAAACLNAAVAGQSAIRIYGCFTVADSWTFVRADLHGLGGERPTMIVVSSREISEKTEAATIVKILKSIVAEHRASTASQPLFL